MRRGEGDRRRRRRKEEEGGGRRKKGGRGRQEEKGGREEEVATLCVSVFGSASVCSLGFGCATIFGHVREVKTKISFRHEQYVTRNWFKN